MAKLDIEVKFLPDNSVDIIVPPQSGWTFEAASARIAAFKAEMDALNVPIKINGEPERHSGDHAHLHAHTHAH